MDYKVIILLSLVVCCCRSNSIYKSSKDFYDSWIIQSTQTNSGQLYPYGVEFGDEEAQKIDPHITDGGNKINIHYYGSVYSEIQISWHGVIIFGETFAFDGNIEFPNEKYPLEPHGQDPPLLAAYYTETSPGIFKDGNLYYRVIKEEEKTKAQYDIDTLLMGNVSVTIRQNILGSENFVANSLIIATWSKVAPGRCTDQNYNCTKQEVDRNTFQVVLASNDEESHAIMIYDSINWPIHAQGSTTYENRPQMGFNKGFGSTVFTSMPYSKSDDPRGIVDMYGVTTEPGKFVYKLGDKHIHRGGCTLPETMSEFKDVWPLEVFPVNGPSVGGFQVLISGPCLNNDDVISCTFGNDYKVSGSVIDDVRARCVVPPIFQIGILPVVISIGEETYESEITLVNPGDMSASQVILENYESWFTTDPNGDSLTINWNKNDLLGQTPDLENPGDLLVNVKLYGYSESSAGPVLQKDIHLFGSDIPNTDEQYTIKVSENKCQGSTCNTRVGIIRIEATEDKLVGIWSRPFPLGWFTDSPANWCEGSTSGSRTWQDELNKCPCTYPQAITDFANFIVDPDCSSSSHPCLLHPQAKQCFISMQPTSSGAMSRCCYDEEDFLMYAQEGSTGSFSARAHRDGSYPYNQQYTVPYLSYLYHDITPYLSCCGWPTAAGNVDVTKCQSQFMTNRPTQSCKNDETSKHAIAYGDPHFRTFDGLDYTFNAYGEFWMMLAQPLEDPAENFNLQIRMEAPSSQYWNDEQLQNYTGYINNGNTQRGAGTIITGVAMQEGDDKDLEEFPKVMVLLTPPSYTHSLQVFVEDEEVPLGFYDARTQIYPRSAGVTSRPVVIYSQQGVDKTTEEMNVWDPRNVTIVFSSGIGVQVASKEKTLHVIVALPPKYIGKTNGLVGTWNNNTQDDLEFTDGFIAARELMSNITFIDPILSDFETDEQHLSMINYNITTLLNNDNITGLYNNDNITDLFMNDNITSLFDGNNNITYINDIDEDENITSTEDTYNDTMTNNAHPSFSIDNDKNGNVSYSFINNTTGFIVNNLTIDHLNTSFYHDNEDDGLSSSDNKNITDTLLQIVDILQNETQRLRSYSDVERIPYDAIEEERKSEFPIEYPERVDRIGLYGEEEKLNLHNISWGYLNTDNITAENENNTSERYASPILMMINGTNGGEDSGELVIMNDEHLNDVNTNDFGLSLEINSEESRFLYFAATSQEYFTDPNFVPLLNLPADDDPTLPPMSPECLAAYPCKYDFHVTGNKALGQSSLNSMIWGSVTQRISGPGTGIAMCDPPVIENAYFSSNGFTEGSELTFTCREGYSSSGKSMYTCTGGEWQPSINYACHDVSSAGDWWKILLIVLAGIIFLLLLLLLFVCYKRKQKKKMLNNQHKKDNKAERERLAKKQTISVIPLTEGDQHNDSQDSTYRTSVNNPHYHDNLNPDGEPFDAMAQRIEYDNPGFEETTGAPDIGPPLIMNNSRRSSNSRGSSRSSIRLEPIITDPIPLNRVDEPTYDNRRPDSYQGTRSNEPMDDSIPIYSNNDNHPIRVKLPHLPMEDAPPPPPTTGPPIEDTSSHGSTDTIRRHPTHTHTGRPYDPSSVISSIDDSDLDSSMVSGNVAYNWHRPEPDYPYQPRYDLGEDQTLV